MAENKLSGISKADFGIPARGLSFVATTGAFFVCTEFERFPLSASLVGACSQRWRTSV
jgi:hypothetical protein